LGGHSTDNQTIKKNILKKFCHRVLLRKERCRTIYKNDLVNIAIVDRPSKSTDADEMYNQDPTKDTGY